MGLYATTTSLEVLMVGVEFDSLTTSLISKKITQAEAEVNKYLSRRYDITSATFQTAASIPPMVTMLTERYAEGLSWQAMSRGGASKEWLAMGVSMIKEVKENLAQIAAYKVDLLATSGSVIQDMSNTAYRVLSNTEGYTETFAEDAETSWVVDRDKLDDIGNERG